MFESFILILFVAIFGACFGSFINVLAIRLHNMSSLAGRSRCLACDRPIRPRHLVPIFSWLALRGRCADCHAKIHIQYPIVEVLAVALTIIAAYRHYPLGSEWYLCIIESFLYYALLVLAIMDLRWKELPLEIMFGIALCFFLLHLFTYQSWHMSVVLIRLSEMMFSLLVPLIFFGTQWLISRGKWLGSGDVWFGVMLGMIFSSWRQVSIAIYLSYMVGGGIVGMLYVFGLIKRGMRVPFAPALAVGALLTLWFGGTIEAWVSTLSI